MGYSQITLSIQHYLYHVFLDNFLMRFTMSLVLLLTIPSIQ